MVGLMDYFMPGETAGVPDTTNKSRFSGLLDDPMLQMGLGILANSQGTSFGTALGRGGMQAMQGLQYNRQFEQNKQLRDLQTKEATRKSKQYDDMEKAKQAFKLKYPEYAELVDLDPTLAIKASNPNIAKNGADPYYTTIPTNAGLGKFNARDGSFELITNPDGTPYIKSSDDPVTRGKVKAAETYGGGLFKPNTDVDGVVSTDSQVALGANPSLAGMDFLGGINPSIPVKQSPQPSVPKSANNFPRVSPAEQAGRDDMRLQILLDEQKRIGGAGVDHELDAEIKSVGSGRIPAMPSFSGIKVPTKAQQAGAAEQAKSNVNLVMDPQITSAVTNASNQSNLTYQPQIDAAKKEATLKAEAQTQAGLELPQNIAQGQETSKLIDDLIAHPGFKKSVGLNSYNPLNKVAGTEANDFNVRLEQLKGKQFLQAFQSLKGGGAITEIEGKKATDAISRMNTSTSEKEFRKAATEFKEVIDAGVKRAQQRAGVAPSGGSPSNKGGNVFDSMPKASQYKGKIIRDDVTGKRYQSNGLQWKEVK